VSCRPWELQIFAICASQDPWYKEVVLGPHRLQSLFSALEYALSNIDSDDHTDYSHRAILSCLYWISENSWVAQDVEPSAMRILLNVVRQTREDSFNSRCWASMSIHRIISHQPALLRTLYQENAPRVFENFKSTPIPQRAPMHFKGCKELANEALQSLLQRLKKWPVESGRVSDPLLEITASQDNLLRNIHVDDLHVGKRTDITSLSVL